MSHAISMCNNPEMYNRLRLFSFASFCFIFCCLFLMPEAFAMKNITFDIRTATYLVARLAKPQGQASLSHIEKHYQEVPEDLAP